MHSYRQRLLGSASLVALSALGIATAAVIVPVDSSFAAGAVCGTFVPANTIANPAQGDPNNIATNTACGQGAEAGPGGEIDATAIGADSVALAGATAIGHRANATALRAIAIGQDGGGIQRPLPARPGQDGGGIQRPGTRPGQDGGGVQRPGLRPDDPGFRPGGGNDFNFNQKMNRSLIFELATANFIGRREDALFLGPAGSGKSHIAQAIGQAAIQQGYRVLYRETYRLLDELAEATIDGTRKEFIEAVVAWPLLIIDDLGMRKLPLTAAEDLLEIIMRRYERASTLVTSNRPVEDWGKLLGDAAAVGAMLDRLLHHGHVLKFGPRSWRTKTEITAAPLQ